MRMAHPPQPLLRPVLYPKARGPSGPLLPPLRVVLLGRLPAVVQLRNLLGVVLSVLAVRVPVLVAVPL